MPESSCKQDADQIQPVDNWANPLNPAIQLLSGASEMLTLALNLEDHLSCRSARLGVWL